MESDVLHDTFIHYSRLQHIFASITTFLQDAGGFDGLLSSLAVLAVMAHITDGMCAIVDHRPIGRAGIQDVFKSILIFILIGVGNILDTNVLTNTPTLRTAVTFFYLSVEGIIILSNSAYLGLPVPDQMKKILEQMRQ